MTKEQFLMYIIRSVILEYRISIETASKLFGGNPNDLYNRVIDTDDFFIKNALLYILDYETKVPNIVDQKEAKIDALKFLIKFRNAKSSEEKVKLVNQLNDKTEIDKIRNKNTEYFTSREYELITEYRYKYALTRAHVAREFGCSSKNLYNKEVKLDEETRKKFEVLNSYHNSRINGRNYPTGKRV